MVAPCPSAASASSPSRPNIVFVLTDDLSTNLVPYMPHVLALERRGTTFTNYTVTDSLCCPSRSSIFTGRYPHNTGVFTNAGPDGGFPTFYRRGEESSTFGTALQSTGYRTAMMGKYLNGYMPRQPLAGTLPYVPPGWNEWDVAGSGYNEFKYYLNQNHKPVYYGSSRQDYLTDVLADRGKQYIGACSRGHKPFFLELATFAPHRPFIPAPRDRSRFKGLLAPRDPAYDQLPSDPPRWLAHLPPLPPAEISHIDRVFRLRVLDDLAVDRAIGILETAISKAGDTTDTDFFFSSDNGYHLGEYRLPPGKMTAFDTDIRVPLVAAGPGIAVDHVSSQVAENVDLAPTFEALAGLSPQPSDGRSLVPLLRGDHPADWRTAALIEHHGALTSAQLGPDDEGNGLVGNPPSYEALRTPDLLYVEYVDGERELYDLTHDPYELHNLASTRPAQMKRLHRYLHALEVCSGSSCWTAGHVPLTV
jgi:N-acetylglucosamine-6-sulfatase